MYAHGIHSVLLTIYAEKSQVLSSKLFMSDEVVKMAIITCKKAGKYFIEDYKATFWKIAKSYK